VRRIATARFLSCLRSHDTLRCDVLDRRRPHLAHHQCELGLRSLDKTTSWSAVDRVEQSHDLAGPIPAIFSLPSTPSKASSSMFATLG